MIVLGSLTPHTIGDSAARRQCGRHAGILPATGALLKEEAMLLYDPVWPEP